MCEDCLNLNTESIFAGELLRKASSCADHLVRTILTVIPGSYLHYLLALLILMIDMVQLSILNYMNRLSIYQQYRVGIVGQWLLLFCNDPQDPH